MVQGSVLPNKFTYPFVLKACAGIGDLNLGKSVHGSVVKFGFDDDVHVCNTIVHMYCYCGAFATGKGTDIRPLLRALPEMKWKPEERN